MSIGATEVPVGAEPYGSGRGWVASAASFQTQTAAIAATARITHQPIGQLDADVRQLARDFPLGTAGAIATVEAVQRLGLSSKEQVPQIRAVSREVTQLAYATNTSAPAMATGFGQLNRQLASLDPSRLRRMGDVLTTVSARSGAAATDVLAFARGIAPLAQQAGIGETAVLGISGAFAKLGDDSGSAITAVNKILGDLNRSVREGSNDMAAYAQITGMTVDKFRELYKANPAQALAAVTTSIGRAGPRGSYQLETLGLEGVRTQRSLLELSQSGGLQAAVDQAVGAYGNGSTAKAAQAATQGLDDALTRFHTTAGQVGQVMAGPVLKPMTAFVNLLQKLVSPLTAVAGTRGAQDLITAGVFAGGAGLLGKRVFGGMQAGATGALIGTSGPVRGFAGGIAAGRAGGDLGLALDQGMLSRYGGDMLIRQTAGAPLGSPMMHPVNTAAMRAGAAVGSLFPVGGYGGYGLRQAVSDLPYLGGAGAGAYLRSQAELFRLARTPAADRQLVMRPFGEAYTKFADTRTGLREQLAAGTLSHGDYRDAMGGALKTLREEVRSTSSIFHGLSQTSSGLWAVLKEGTAFGAYAGGRVVKAGAGMLGGLASSIGLPTLALGAGVGAYSLYERNRNEQKTFDTHVENLDIYGAVNAYRDAVGKAGEATITLADQMAAAVKTVSASVQSFPAAQHVSNSDLVAANSSRNKITRRYSGSNTQIAAQVSALDLAGLEPSDVQGAKLDLLRAGVSADQVDSILSSVGTPGGVRGQAAAAAGSLTPQMISGLVGGAAKAPGLGSAGFGWRAMQRSIGRSHTGGLWTTLGKTGAGTPQLGKQAGAMVDELSGALGQERFNLGQKFGDSYGLQRELVDADKAMGVALKTHRADLVVGMEQQLTKQLTGKTIHGVSASDIESAGGFEKFLAARGVKIGGQSVADMMAHPTAARLQPSYMQNMLSGLGASALVPFFSSTTQRGAAGVAQQTVADSVANPQDLQRQADAVNTMVTAAQKAGVSLSALAAQAGGALGSTSQNDVNYQLLLGVISESQRRQAVAAPFMTPGQQFGAQAQTGLAMAGVTGNDTNAQNLRQQGLSTLADLQSATVASFHARIMAQYSFEVESRRAGEDYHRQLSRAEQDFQIQRYRTIRDYNIQVRREIQDAAAQDYNPYQRIQAQPVWDAFNLIGNLTEHRDALRAQVANIRKLKERGFTDATLRLLDAYNPANAQQIAELAADLGSAPNLAGQYNKVSAQTESAAGQLLTGAPTYQRQRADFKRAMADQKADFDRQEARGHTDFLTAMSRQAQDLHAQDLVITGDMTSLQADMNRILHGQQIDWSTTLVSGLKDTLAQVKKYAPQITTTLNTATTGNGSGVVAGPGYGTGKRTWTGTPASSGGKTYSRAGASSGVNSGFLLTSASRPGTDTDHLGNPDLKWGKNVAVAPDNRRLSANARLAEKMATNYGWGDGPEWAALFQIWQQESGFSTSAGSPTKNNPYGIPQAFWSSKMSNNPMASTGRDWKTNPATQITWGLNYILERYGDPLGAWAHKSRTGWYGDGSIFTSPQLIGVGERGSEAVLPLNAHGATFIADVMRSYLGDHDRSAMMGGGSVVINHTESHHYDQRIDLTGSHFEVKANTPRELADALEQKARADNLTKPRSVPWRT